MTRVRIIKADDDHNLFVCNTRQSADIPIDGQFHDIHDDLIPVLEDSAVEFEIENAAAGGEKTAAAGGAAGLGGSAAPLSPLDHDGDGKKGGSKRGAASTRAKGATKKRGKSAAPKTAKK